jgi:GDP/UDP-N,N'-diacetylbacillosamine 2-epimerase (hydrolysing)
MTVGFLTSSRADYGIYLPLLKAMKADPFFDVRIIAFGTHLSSFHGHTIDAIKKDGFVIDHEVEHVLASDTEEAIATSMALAFMKFASIWGKEKNRYDLVFCLGDRYEMFAAVGAAAPFGIPFAHLHGGETTLGAIDNEFRHCLTVFSKLHFTATDQYAERVAAIKGSNENVYSVGSVSLDGIASIKLLTNEEFFKRFSIDLSKPSLLVTYHPETVGAEANIKNASELVRALTRFDDYQVIITMPNSDAMGNTMREVYMEFASENGNVVLVENFGKAGYFTCINSSSLIVGNSSSGIIEAASFKKYAVNIGGRQKGRAVSENVINCIADANAIEDACRQGLGRGSFEGQNIYYKETAVESITKAVKKWKA